MWESFQKLIFQAKVITPGMSSLFQKLGRNIAHFSWTRKEIGIFDQNIYPWCLWLGWCPTPFFQLQLVLLVLTVGGRYFAPVFKKLAVSTIVSCTKCLTPLVAYQNSIIYTIQLIYDCAYGWPYSLCGLFFRILA